MEWGIYKMCIVSKTIIDTHTHTHIHLHYTYTNICTKCHIYIECIFILHTHTHTCKSIGLSVCLSVYTVVGFVSLLPSGWIIIVAIGISFK